MKLYFSPFACSLAAHIALREAELDFELVRQRAQYSSQIVGSLVVAECSVVVLHCVDPLISLASMPRQRPKDKFNISLRQSPYTHYVAHSTE